MDIRKFTQQVTPVVAQQLPSIRQFCTRAAASALQATALPPGQKYLNVTFPGLAEAEYGAQLAGCSRLYLAIHPGTSNQALLDLWSRTVKRDSKGKLLTPTRKAAAEEAWAQDLRHSVRAKWHASARGLAALFGRSNQMIEVWRCTHCVMG